MPDTFPPTHARRSITLIASVFAVAGALLLLAPVAGALDRSGSDSVGFGVAPLRFDVETKAGNSSTHQIMISNSDSVANRYTFSKEDFQGDKDEPDATPVLLGGKFNSDISGYDWITAPDPVTVPAGGSRTVTVRVSVPAGATGGHYAALIVSGEARTAGEVVAQSRVGVLFMMNAGGVPPPDIVITEIRQVGPTTTVTEYINNGTTDTSPTGTITQDPVGPGPNRTIPGECTTALPGGSGKCTFETGKDGGAGGTDGSGNGLDAGLLPAGPVEQYVDIVGDPGEEGTAARGELPTEWAGTWTSLLLPLVGIALFVLYFLFLRRRRKDGEGGEDDADGDLAYGGTSY